MEILLYKRMNELFLKKSLKYLLILIILIKVNTNYIKKEIIFVGAEEKIDCSLVEYNYEGFGAQPNNNKVYMIVDRIEDENFIKSGLTKYASVFGIRIMGEENVLNRKILYTLQNLAELLDPLKKGAPGNKKLVQKMRDRHAILVLAESDDSINNIINKLPKEYECMYFIVFELESDINPYGSYEPDCKDNKEGNKIKNKYDKCIGIICDFVIQVGYPETYPLQSELGILLEEAFEESKRKHWLKIENIHYRQCDIDCQKIIFQSWALSSIFNANICSCRQNGVWKLCTAEEMRHADPRLYAALTQNIKKPTGTYWSPAVVQ